MKLVYLKDNNGGFSETTGTGFKPHTPYRCVQLDDNTMLVYGVPFDLETFNSLFVDALERIKAHFELIGLTKNGEAITKKEFKERAYEVKYGKGKDSFWTYWFYTHPKECMYRFSPSWAGGSKAVQTTNAYDSYIDLLNGDLSMVDSEDIEFGNGGMPLGSFRRLDKRFYYYDVERKGEYFKKV